MKRFVTLICIVLTTLAGWAQSVKPLPSLHVEGKWLVDTYGNHVVLHGCMDTPSMWFNGNRWGGGYNDTGAKNCMAYFENSSKQLCEHTPIIVPLSFHPIWFGCSSVKDSHAT